MGTAGQPTPRWIRPAALACAILGAGVALMVIVGMVSRWSFEEWQTPDWIIIVSGVVLWAVLSLIARDWDRELLNLAPIPLLPSGLVLLGLTVVRFDRVWWAWIDLGTAVVFAGAAVLALLVASAHVDRSLPR